MLVSGHSCLQVTYLDLNSRLGFRVQGRPKERVEKTIALLTLRARQVYSLTPSLGFRVEASILRGGVTQFGA